MFFKNPFDVYKSELDRLSEHGDEGNHKLCSLALCVVFNNRLKEKWFEGKVTDEQRCIIKDTCNACNINTIPKTKLKKALDTLDGTFICKQYGIYRTIHDKLLDFLAHYFGQKITECLVDHGDSDLIHERFIWQKSADDKTSSIHFIIKIPDDYLESYLQRLIKDWSTGKVVNVFNNTNMQLLSFRQKLLEHLKQLHKSIQVSLVNTKDTERQKASCESGNTPLIMTCYNGYTDMVQWIIDNDVDVDQCRDDGATGLHIASQEGHTDIVKLLLEKNPIVDLYNRNGCTPLLLASHNGHTNIVKLLLQNNLYVDLCDKNGRSSLLLASQDGHTDILKLLLDWNSNIDLCDNNGCSSLLLASQNGHTDIVTLLIERNSKIDQCNKNGCSPLIQATRKGHTDIVKLLLERNADVDLCDNDGFTPLIFSCISNDISTVQLLMKHKPNINAQTYDGGNALYFSALHINIAITLLLLDNNADCNICIHSKQCIIDKFGHRGKRLEKEKRGLFDSLVKNTSSHITDYVNKKSEDYSFDVVAGSSLLHIACFMGRINVVRCLLDYNANINMPNEDGTTPLFYACEIGHKDIVCLLLDKGADTQICRLDSKSPLQIAIDNGHTSIIMIVTEHTKKEEQLPF